MKKPTVKPGMCLLNCLCGIVWWALSASALGAEEQPGWELEIAESESVSFVAEQWHVKDYGWLLTCRLEVASLNLLLPISHLELKGFDAAGEEVWSYRSVVRRRDFKSSLVGRADYFARILVKDAPESVVKMELSFDSGRKSPGDE